MIGLLFFSLLVGFISEISGQEADLFADDDQLNAPTAATVLPDSVNMIWSGLFDMRAVSTGKAIPWQKGGTNLTRYGGIDTDHDGTGDRGSLEFQVSQASLVAEVLVSGKVGAHLQFNYDDPYDGSQSNGRLGVAEGYLLYERNPGEHQQLKVRMGRLFPPISLEHPGTAWSTRYSITPSALNTWVGEELKPAAVEMAWRYDYAPYSHLDITLAPFSGNDPAGEILSWRGWALHDYQSTVGGRLKFYSETPATISPQNQWGEPFKEMDGRLGVYGKIGWTPSAQWHFNSFYFNSLSDPKIKDTKNEYSWQTEFTVVSFQLQPVLSLTLLGQAASGNTFMGNPENPGVDNDFNTWYLMASYDYEAHRITLRHDSFAVKDLDSYPYDDNNSEGTANTVAYFFRAGEFYQVGLEYLNIQSERYLSPDLTQDPEDTLYQLMLRMVF
ncbi:MAG: hypothetical protein HQM11_00115 [SAR324 cluster bacterium]|nr:hypothetical protein [SAR324 cluster bacterium]